MRKVGIFGGSFDPIHMGHIELSRYVLNHSDLDEVWLMVAPLNPLKPQGYVATDEQRLEMARLAVANTPGVKVSDFEFSLPVPSYTYNTLTKLREAYPGIDFRLIVGGDNWAHFDRWRNPQEILNEFGIIVYPRPGEKLGNVNDASIKIEPSSVQVLEDAPQMPVSSTHLRSLLREDASQCASQDKALSSSELLDELLPASVLSYIESKGIYKGSHDA